MTTYISVQPVDYDDYPMGADTKIGPFESERAAVEYLKNSPKFIGQYPTKNGGFLYYAEITRLGHTTVTIQDTEKTFMIKPEEYDER